MGCFSACFSLNSTQAAKLLDSDGGLIEKVRLPVKAAELMLERPGYVISSVDVLRRTRRISALKADDELVGGKIYVLVALGRIGSKVSVVELENLELGCKNKGKKIGSKVLPAAAAEEGKKEDIGSGISGSDQLSCGRGNYKRWNPNLESISEDFCHSFREKH
ncbi:uncharacterized protein LOC111461238 [Cucurbita moschata]|uniref:Uncharacterized protein LOC111461238 n=1 Tax=Cucurbita moschata TaxID=3662 RepID=A0A6J1H9B3_CUCMO|nr:uncharacterized protein LOC111461238 [Cucurbita moschata]